MDIWLAIFVGCVIGIVIGVLAQPLLAKIESLRPPVNVDPHQLIPPELSQAIDLLKSAAFIVGQHDEVLYANAPARALNLVRGSRVLDEALLDLIRQSRKSGKTVATKLTQKGSRFVKGRELGIRIAVFTAGLELIIADDRSAMLRANEVRKDFVANVSHELKTPVGAIQVLAEALTEAADEPDSVRFFAQKLVTETGRLTDLIQQIIELSRLQGKDPMAKAKIVKLDEVVAEAVAQTSELARANQVQLRVTGEQGLQVMGNATQLTIAVNNLIVNAIKYSDQKAKIAITLAKQSADGDEFATIAVADNGIGIKAEEQDRIFERFYRVDYHRNRSAGGSGLGLSIVKHIVEAHYGQIQVWSQVGQGSTFTIWLPINLAEDSLAASASDLVDEADSDQQKTSEES